MTRQTERTSGGITRRNALKTGIAFSSGLAFSNATIGTVRATGDSTTGTSPPLTGGVEAHKKEASSPETVVDFSSSGLQPENIAIDKKGDIYMSMGPAAEIRRLPKNKTKETGLGTDDTEQVTTFSDGFAIGVVADNQGTLYVARAFSSESGVWKVSPDGTKSELAALGGLPNGILLAKKIKGAKDGVLVTESFGDVIWHIDFDGTLTQWKQHPLLAPATFIGANGLAVDRNGDVFVAHLDNGQIIRIPVNTDGSAGEPAVFAEDSSLVGADGIVFDAQDHLYVAVNSGGRIVHIESDGSPETVADGLNFPSDVAFGTTTSGPPQLFLTEFPFDDPDVDGSLKKIDVGIAGDVE